MELICIRHPKYQGKGSPVLSCKACCSIYISQVKTKYAEELDSTKWLEQKVEDTNRYNLGK